MKSIKVSDRLHEFLLKHGTKSDSFEQIIWRLIGQKKIMKEDKKSLLSEYEEKLNKKKKVK